MRDPLFFSSPSSRDPWLYRIGDNLYLLLTRARVFPSSANGAPLHLPRWEKRKPIARAQSASLLSHAAILAALLLFAVDPRGPTQPKASPEQSLGTVLAVPHRLLDLLRGQPVRGGTGNGSGHDLLPPLQGNLPSRSSIQLLKPTLPQNQNPELPVPPTILDDSAPAELEAVNHMGIPWMVNQNHSSGRGKGQTIGEGRNDSIGDTPGNLAGQGGPPGPYLAHVTLPECAYCPEPPYTDQAREAKMQGRVTLRVLVGREGRATQIELMGGVGMGLDERAMETVRTWRFLPARDSARQAVPAWVTIEVTFHLM